MSGERLVCLGEIAGLILGDQQSVAQPNAHSVRAGMSGYGRLAMPA
jgi:hypothetical protein